MLHQLKDKLHLLDPISLDELSVCKLLNRIDTKYICNVKYLPEIIERARKDFKIQTSKADRIFGYESLYFDTPGLQTYFDHHQGKRIRYKVRFRKYIDTGDAFLEVKKKKNYTRTDKKRNQFEFSSTLEHQHEKFLRNHIKVPKTGFEPTIWTLFDRITLAGKNQLERITIDTNIRFKDKNHEISLPGLSIIEVKRDKAVGISPFSQILRDLNIRPYGFSKYIMGNVLLNPNLKHNRFQKKIVTVNKICYGT
jgi:hypothetical protein